MHKLFFNRSLADLLFIHGFILISILLSGLLLCACQAQSNTPIVQTVEVEIGPTPSATPACTPLLPGMSVIVHPLVKHHMIIQLKGFKPGERVVLTGNTEYRGNGQGFGVLDLRIGPDGIAYVREASSADTSAAINHWHFQVTYSGGVACTDINIIP